MKFSLLLCGQQACRCFYPAPCPYVYQIPALFHNLHYKHQADNEAFDLGLISPLFPMLNLAQ